MQWQPTGSIESLRKRAALVQTVRNFFSRRDVLEVETPILGQATVTDVHLDALSTEHALDTSTTKQNLYLHTSPEYAMKRMLAGGFPDIFQICKCFREDEIGRLHNPEFTMLEWYRKGFSMQSLIDEAGELINLILSTDKFEQISYQEAFMRYVNFDPLNSSLQQLLPIATDLGFAEYSEQLRAQGFADQHLFDALLQAIFAQEIESKIGLTFPICVTHFPASQAALAKLDVDGASALRFEFYYKGVELANGFEELTDAKLQQQRFETDNQQREALSKSTKPIDKRLLAALESSLPPCSGIALGLDRLIMLALNADSISKVMSFDIYHA